MERQTARPSGFAFGTFPQELRYALRKLIRLPGLSIAVVLTLALAIAANVSVFSLVHGVLISPLPYPNSDRIVGFWMLSPAFANNTRIRQSTATYLHFAKENRSFDGVALAEPETVTVAYKDSRDFKEGAERLQVASVTAALFDLLGVEPIRGRALTPEDNLPGAEPVLVLGYALWSQRFHQDANAIGEHITVDGVQRRIIGVLPRNVTFPAEDTQLWLPLTFNPAAPEPLRFRYGGYGLLKAGVTEDAATRDLDRLIQTLPEAYPDGFTKEVIEEAKIRAQVRGFKEEMVGDVKPALWILLGAVLAVLLIAAVNLASLFAVRAEGRRQELAVRSALGARRWQLLNSLLAEWIWLAAAGAIAGLLLGLGAIHVLKQIAIDEIPRLNNVGLNASVLLFTAGISILVGLLAGALPTMDVGWRSLSSHLLAGSPRVGEKPRQRRLRDALVVIQVAIALVLVVGSGLLVRSYWSLSHVNPGFQPQNVLTLRIALPRTHYAEWSQVADFFARYLNEARALPGVEAAAAASDFPLRDNPVFLPYIVEGTPDVDAAVRPTALAKLVSDDYFTTLGVPMIAGRPLERLDAEQGRPAVVVNKVIADRHWLTKNPINSRIRVGTGKTWLTVVGVVGNVKDRSLVETEPPAILYMPLMGPEKYSFARWEMSVAVRSTRPGSILESMRRTLAQMDRGLPVFRVRTLDQVLADASARTRFTALLLVVMAIGALVLSAVGLYGLLAYTVRRQRREIGIRMVLGAQRTRVRRMVVGKALLLSGIGVLLGGIAARYLGRLLTTQLFQVESSDPLTLATAIGVLMIVTWVAGDIAARRAAQLDPIQTLREDE